MIVSMSDDSLHSRLLIERLAAGDERAFEQVFRACYGRVYATAFRLLGTRAEAEEVAQEAFLRLHRRPPLGRENPNLVGWLVTVATNLAYNRIRQNRRRQAREGRSIVPEDASARAVDAQDSVDRAARVRQVLTALPERQALILLLRHSGLSYAEVAAEANVAPGSVGTLLARAQHAFRLAYEALEAEDDAQASH